MTFSNQYISRLIKQNRAPSNANVDFLQLLYQDLILFTKFSNLNILIETKYTDLMFRKRDSVKFTISDKLNGYMIITRS